MDKIMLRDYQKNAVIQIKGAFALGSTEVCLSAPTSYGKTFTIMSFIKDQIEEGKSVVFMMNLTALIEQTIEAAKILKIPFKVIAAEFDGQEFDHQANLSICMQQTLHARLDKIKIDCDLLVVDEFHRSFRTNTMEEVKKKLKPGVIAAVSATPYCEKGYALPDVDVIETVTLKELTDSKYLTPLKTYSTEFSESIDYSDSGSGEYSENFLNGKINNDTYNSQVVKAWLNIAKGKKTIVFATGIAHAEALTAQFTLKGVNALSFHSGLSKKDSKANMKSFKSKDGSEVLVSVNSILVGFDYPGIECIVACRPTKTRRVWQQAVGRGIRLFPGKKECILLDLAMWTAEHGFYDAPYHPPKLGDREALKKLKEEVAIQVMPAIVQEEPTLITPQIVIGKIKELKQKAKRIPELDFKDLLAIYETSQDPRQIIEIGYDINRRKTGQDYKTTQVNWASETWFPFIEKYPQYKSRILRTLRTLMKNKVAKGAKPAGIHYSAGWLQEQPPYCLYTEPDSVDVSEEVNNNYNAYDDIDMDNIPF